MKEISFLLFVLLLWTNSVTAQQVINFRNPSFEGTSLFQNMKSPMGGIPPDQWWNCGFDYETPVDTQPGSFNVETPAQDQKNYLGMVVRETGTYESVCQRLPTSLTAGNCYKVSVFLSKSDTYLSSIRNQFNEKQFTKPCVFRIYGGNGPCENIELLSESSPIDHDYWKEYHFKLKPSVNYSYFFMEVYYETPVLFPYNGHILVDNISPITQIACDEDVHEFEDVREVVAEAPKKEPEPTKKAIQREIKEKEDEGIKQTKSKKKILEDLEIANLHEGVRVELKTLYFHQDSYKITPSSEEVLNELSDFLIKHKNVFIEIGGHTNGRPKDDYCFKMSKQRADAVAKYLINKGVDEKQIATKGYGKTKPIADNATEEGRKRNQRVEIKILKVL